jgi:catechol 2,3-dioxygenase-like lactoylglutathione lyase family enzyme
MAAEPVGMSASAARQPAGDPRGDMPAIEFAHTGWVTRSLDESLAFWTGVMGFTVQSVVERSGDWIAGFTGVPGARLRIAHLNGLGQRLEFLEFTAAGTGEAGGLPPQSACTAHVCVRSKDVGALRERILDAGGSLQGDITTITEGPSAGARGLYLRDPCGFLIEIIEMR